MAILLVLFLAKHLPSASKEALKLEFTRLTEEEMK